MSQCKAVGCKRRERLRRGLCHKHYERLRTSPSFVPRVLPTQIKLRSDNLKPAQMNDCQMLAIISLLKRLPGGKGGGN